MNKNRLTRIVTVAVLLAALAVGVVRKAGLRGAAPRPSESPQGAIYAMLNAGAFG